MNKLKEKKQTRKLTAQEKYSNGLSPMWVVGANDSHLGPGTYSVEQHKAIKPDIKKRQPKASATFSAQQTQPQLVSMGGNCSTMRPRFRNFDENPSESALPQREKTPLWKSVASASAGAAGQEAGITGGGGLNGGADSWSPAQTAPASGGRNLLHSRPHSSLGLTSAATGTRRNARSTGTLPTAVSFPERESECAPELHFPNNHYSTKPQSPEHRFGSIPRFKSKLDPSEAKLRPQLGATGPSTNLGSTYTPARDEQQWARTGASFPKSPRKTLPVKRSDNSAAEALVDRGLQMSLGTSVAETPYGKSLLASKEERFADKHNIVYERRKGYNLNGHYL
jgi:hypothetical protein